MPATNTQFKIGHVPWNVGIPRTLEEREKMSERRRGIPAWNKGIPARDPERLRTLRIGMVPWSKGRQMTDDFKNKVSEGRLISKKVPRREQHHNWKGGTTKFRHHVMELATYKEWRQKVFEKDSFTCVCGKRGGDLHADHIVSFREIVEKFKLKTVLDAVECAFLWNIDNGRTRCVPCHRLTETFGFH